ncbi:hypothetical protein [Nonomuraea basaltis]|uniref:hypothetical protein n=1 Tax=Nonomuraea basaltis TaxID=2495887 RepID=UPI00198033E0|nr:hypothetical protein [Nonomuraea basaltis]
MTAARDAEGRPTDPRLPAKLAAHPSERAVLARRRAGAVSRPAVIDAACLRELCLAAGADDAAAVSLDRPDLAGEREHALAALPGTRTLIAMVVRMNRDNCRSPARSVATQEFHQTSEWPRVCRPAGNYRRAHHQARRRSSPRPSPSLCPEPPGNRSVFISSASG